MSFIISGKVWLSLSQYLRDWLYSTTFCKNSHIEFHENSTNTRSWKFWIHKKEINSLHLSHYYHIGVDVIKFLWNVAPFRLVRLLKFRRSFLLKSSRSRGVKLKNKIFTNKHEVMLPKIWTFNCVRWIQANYVKFRLSHSRQPAAGKNKDWNSLPV